MQDDEMYKKLSEYFGSCKKTNELMSDIENEYIELINTEQAQKEYILLSVKLPDLLFLFLFFKLYIIRLDKSQCVNYIFLRIGLIDLYFICSAKKLTGR